LKTLLILDELIALNEKFHKARHDYDVLMESSVSRYSRPAPAPSTNPFGQAPPYQAGPPPFQPSIQQPNRPVSNFGATSASPPPSAHGYGTGATQPAATGYPPAPAWEGYQQPKPWDTAAPPPPQANTWETQHPHRRSWDGQQQPPSTSQWETPNQQPQQDNLAGQWDDQYQPWDQDRPGNAPVATSYPPPPTQTTQVHHYGGGLDELVSPINAPTDRPSNPWYDNQPNPTTTAPLPTTNTSTGGFTTQTSPPPNHPYFSPPPQATSSKPQDAQEYPYGQYSQPSQPPPPPPSQAPPTIPFEQKPPYPVGRGRPPPPPFYSQPKPPATYNPQQQGQGDRYAGLRSLSAGSNHNVSTPGAWPKEENGKADGSGGGYYDVST
jgi:hypothetical protein